MWNNEGKLSDTLSTTWKFLDKLNNEAMLCNEMSLETYYTNCGGEERVGERTSDKEKAIPKLWNPQARHVQRQERP